MWNELKKNWKTILNGVLFLILILFGSIERTVELTLGLLGFQWSIIDIFRLVLVVIGLIGLGFVVYSWWKQRKTLSVSEELPTKLGLEYFNSRKELTEKYPLENLLSQAKSRIVFLGGSLESIVDIHRLLEELIKRNKIKIEFLIQDPEWVKTAKLDKGMSSGTLSKGIERTLEIISIIRGNLGLPEKNNCIIKMYGFHATHSGIVIDPESPDAKALIEFYPYDTDAMSKPSIIVNKKENEDFFEKWWRSFEYVLKPEEYTIQEEEQKLPEPSIYDEEQLQYRSELKDEIEQIRQELENIVNPKEIPYPVWLCDHKPVLKRKLIGNDEEYEIIQDFYTALQERYNYQKGLKHPDGEFTRLNAKCIDNYDTVMEKVTWKEEDEFPEPPKLRVKLVKLDSDKEPKEIHVRFYDSPKIRKHEARFCFVTVENVEGKRIKGLRPCFNGDNMLIVSPYGKKHIATDYHTSIRFFDKRKSDVYFPALMNDGKKAIKSVDFPPDKRASITFALFVTLKDVPYLDIPAETIRDRPIPSNFLFNLEFRTKDHLPFPVTTFEVDVRKWDDFDVKEVEINES